MISERYVKAYCKDFTKIENYAEAIADKTQFWVCHHRLELIATGAVVESSKQDLIDWGIYYDRPADELIFLTQSEHVVLHNKTRKGKPAWNKGKKCESHSKETKAKMSESHKGKHWKLVDGKRVYY